MLLLEQLELFLTVVPLTHRGQHVGHVSFLETFQFLFRSPVLLLDGRRVLRGSQFHSNKLGKTAFNRVKLGKNPVKLDEAAPFDAPLPLGTPSEVAPDPVRCGNQFDHLK